MPVKDADYYFHDWTPARKAKFVEYRMAGMHPEWAVYWSTVNRRKAKRLFTPNAVERHMLQPDTWPMKHWVEPILEDLTTTLVRPPQHLFDQLEKD